MNMKIIWIDGIPKRVPSTLETDYFPFAYGNKLEWTPDMLSALREGRRRRQNIESIAEHIGVGYHTCRNKIRELGL